MKEIGGSLSLLSADLVNERKKLEALEKAREKVEKPPRERAHAPPAGFEPDLAGMLAGPGWGFFIEHMMGPYIRGQRRIMLQGTLEDASFARERIKAAHQLLTMAYDAVNLKIPEELLRLFE